MLFPDLNEGFPVFQPLIELLPMAAYGVRAPDGVISWYNSRAADLWGRKPVIGDLDERFCGSLRLYRSDGKYMAHGDTPVGVALKTGASLHGEDVIIEKPDGSRVTVCVHIDPVYDPSGAITGVVNFFYDVTERKRRESDTKAQAEELERAVQQRTASLSRLSRRLMHIQDEERRRLSRELHDGLGQDLSLAKMTVDSLVREGSQDSTLLNVAQEVQLLIDRALEQTRTISYLFHPPLLDELGFRSAVIGYVDGFSTRSRIKVAVDIPRELPRFAEQVETALFRIVQESLTNVYRHSHASEAAIRVTITEGVLQLEISDNGKGFDPADSKGVGLTSIRERLRELEGSLNIHSGQGSRIVVQVPANESLRAIAGGD